MGSQNQQILHFSVKLSPALFLFFSFCPIVRGQQAQDPEHSPKPVLETLYPFQSGNRWGFIHADGTWAIEPRFSSAGLPFRGEFTTIRQNGKMGRIDRSGSWIVKPNYRYFESRSEKDPSISCIGDHVGLISSRGKVLLGATCNEIVLGLDRAFIRKGEQMGIMDFSGRWIRPIEIPWPEKRGLPVASTHNAAWFKKGGKWGLISRDGHLLFDAVFLPHRLSKGESEEDWQHPDGVDFIDGRAWVASGKNRFDLITDKGKELGSFRFDTIQHWNRHLFLFRDLNWKAGLIRDDGTIVVPAQYNDVEPLIDDRAVITKMVLTDKSTPNERQVWTFGFLDGSGNEVIPLGKFSGSDHSQLQPFHEGLTPVQEINGPNPSLHGYIDRDGKFQIPPTFSGAQEFSDGLAAVCKQEGNEVSTRQWGYIDKSAKLVIPYQFRAALSFYRNCAWADNDSSWDDSQWGLIDRSGKSLTKFIYLRPDWYPPHSGEKFLRFSKLGPSYGWLTQEGIEVTPDEKFQTSLGQYDETRVDDDGAWVARAVKTSQGKRVLDWGRIDLHGRVLLEPIYISGSLPVWVPFENELFAMGIADDDAAEKPQDQRQLKSWGYMNHQFKIVAWTPAAKNW